LAATHISAALSGFCQTKRFGQGLALSGLFLQALPVFKKNMG
jgi:hypothetical protein